MTEAIKKIAILVFTQFVSAKECFITPDEQAFLAEDRARMHNKDYVTVKRSEVDVPKASEETAPASEKPKAPVATKPAATTKKTAEELIADMPKVETLEALDALAKGEKRATVLAAIDARRKELTPNEPK